MDLVKLNKLAGALKADANLFQLTVTAKNRMQNILINNYITPIEARIIAIDIAPDSVVDKTISVARIYMQNTPDTELHRYAIALSAGNILKELGRPYYATGLGILEILNRMQAIE